jgi:hypothetical protein
MPRLIVNPGTPDAWTIELQPGVLSLGSSEENNCVIQHSSVSSSHCQVLLSGKGVRVKDVGSTAGTFINGELVEDALLKPGQSLRLGEVEMVLEGNSSPEVSAADGTASSAPGLPPLPPRIATAVAPSGFCKFHPRARARFACAKCGHSFCDLCVNTRLEHGRTQKTCRACGSECESLQAERPRPGTAKGFFASLPKALIYPFTGNGVFLFLAGTVFFVVLGYLPIIGFLFSGYLFNYAKRIVSSSAEGNPKPPDWPDFTNWFDDIILPYLQFLALGVLAFGPAIIVWSVFPTEQANTRIVVIVAALTFGALLAPMGMLALSMFDHFGALNPVSLTWSILRVPGHYLVAAGAFEFILLVNVFARPWIYLLIPLPFLPSLVSGFLNLYFIAVSMRILGLLYANDKDKLGWFRH